MSTESKAPSFKVVDSKFKFHIFSSEIGDKTILYQVIVMKDSLFIFINYKNARYLNELSLAMKNPYSKAPVSSKLIGNFIDESSQALAIKTSKVLDRPVYISYNIEADRYMSLLVEKQLFLEIKTHPDKFN